MDCFVQGLLKALFDGPSFSQGPSNRACLTVCLAGCLSLSVPSVCRSSVWAVPGSAAPSDEGDEDSAPPRLSHSAGPTIHSTAPPDPLLINDNMPPERDDSFDFQVHIDRGASTLFCHHFAQHIHVHMFPLPGCY